MSSDLYTKPVILFRFPLDSNHPTDKLDTIYQSLEKKLGGDYHVLAIIENRTDEMKIEIFNSIGADELDIENLKTEFKNMLQTLQTEQ